MNLLQFFKVLPRTLYTEFQPPEPLLAGFSIGFLRPLLHDADVLLHSSFRTMKHPTTKLIYGFWKHIEVAQGQVRTVRRMAHTFQFLLYQKVHYWVCRVRREVVLVDDEALDAAPSRFSHSFSISLGRQRAVNQWAVTMR